MVSVVGVLCGVGLLLSAYALWVRRNCRRTGYRPLCDLSEHISCTKAFASSAGVTFGVPNPIYGWLFYLVIAALWQNGSISMVRLFTMLAVIASAYLAYVSYVKQRNFCLVCTAIYAVNIALLIAAYQ